MYAWKLANDSLMGVILPIRSHSTVKESFYRSTWYPRYQVYIYLGASKSSTVTVKESFSRLLNEKVLPGGIFALSTQLILKLCQQLRRVEQPYKFDTFLLPAEGWEVYKRVC